LRDGGKEGGKCIPANKERYGEKKKPRTGINKRRMRRIEVVPRGPKKKQKSDKGLKKKKLPAKRTCRRKEVAEARGQEGKDGVGTERKASRGGLKRAENMGSTKPEGGKARGEARPGNAAEWGATKCIVQERKG